MTRARQKKQQTAEEQLEGLRVELGARKERERWATTMLAEAEAGAAHLQEQQVLALSQDEEVEAERLREKRAEVLRAIDEDLGPRVRGAELASRRAAGAVDSFVASSFGTIVAERADGDAEVAGRLERALREVLEAVKAWRVREATLIQLAGKAPDADSRLVAGLHLGDVERDARAALVGGIPRPTMVMPARARVSPDHDRDPSLRQRVRSALGDDGDRAFEVLS